MSAYDLIQRQQSILAQKASFPEPYEVILVDDGATDGCGEL